TPSPAERMRQMLDMARLADEAGLDIVGVGEHHGPGFVSSATATTIAAMAAVGSVEQVVDKIARLMDATGATPYVGQIDIGGQPYGDVARGIELLATRVAPALRGS